MWRFTMRNTTRGRFASRIVAALSRALLLATIFCACNKPQPRAELSPNSTPQSNSITQPPSIVPTKRFDLSAYNIIPVPITPLEKSLVEFNLTHSPKLQAEVDQAKRMDGMRFSIRKYVNPGLPKDERETVERALDAVSGLTQDERHKHGRLMEMLMYTTLEIPVLVSNRQSLVTCIKIGTNDWEVLTMGPVDY
jgi:hypothetical protein